MCALRCAALRCAPFGLARPFRDRSEDLDAAMLVVPSYWANLRVERSRWRFAPELTIGLVLGYALSRNSSNAFWA